MKKICPECHQEFDGGKFCPECGAKLVDAEVKLFCPNCNIVVEKGKFCPECGSKLVEKLIGLEDSSPAIQSAPIECPVCGFPNEPGATVCSACGYPLAKSKAITENTKKETSISAEDEAILAKYREEDGDLVEIVEKEVEDSAFEELGTLAEKGIPEAEFLLAALYLSSKFREQDWNKSYEIMAKAAEEGNKLAYSALGAFYASGIIVNQDIDEGIRRLSLASESPLMLGILGDIYRDAKGNYKMALECYTKLAGMNKNDGYAGLGSLYANGLGVPQDYKKAFDYYNQAVALGDSNAEYEIGNMYLNGNGTSIDYNQALYWFNEAAEHGNSVAYNAMAFMYLKGIGVEEDKERASDLFKTAAKLGNAEAMKEVGNYYAYVIFDGKKAVSWYKKATAMTGAAACAEAYYELGNCYKNGFGVPQDEKKAEEYYKMAQDAGYVIPNGNPDEDLMDQPDFDNSPVKNAIQAIEDGDYDLAISILKPLANSGDLDAQYQLARCYIHGYGVKKNSNVAASWLNKSAKAGYALSQYSLGLKYEEGYDDTIINDETAAKWYEKAADQGFAEAQFRLGVMYDEGRGVKPNGKKAMEMIQAAAKNGSEEAKKYLESLKSGPSALIESVKIERDVMSGSKLGMNFKVSFSIDNMKDKAANCSICFFYDWINGPTPVDTNPQDPKDLSVDGTLIVGTNLTPGFSSTRWDDLKFFVPYDILCNHNNKGEWPILARVVIWDLSKKKGKVLKVLEKRFSVSYTKKLFSDPVYTLTLK